MGFVVFSSKLKNSHQMFCSELHSDAGLKRQRAMASKARLYAAAERSASGQGVFSATSAPPCFVLCSKMMQILCCTGQDVTLCWEEFYYSVFNALLHFFFFGRQVKRCSTEPLSMLNCAYAASQSDEITRDCERSLDGGWERYRG